MVKQRSRNSPQLRDRREGGEHACGCQRASLLPQGQPSHVLRAAHVTVTPTAAHRLRMEGAPRSWNPKAPRSTTRPWAQGPRPCPSFGVPGSPTVGPTVELHITALWLAGRANAMASESPVTGEAQHTALLCPHHLANLHSKRQHKAHQRPDGPRTLSLPGPAGRSARPPGHQSGLLTALLVEPQPQA